MEPYLYCLISTYVPEHSELLTFLAGGKLLREDRPDGTYANGVLHSFEDKPATVLPNGATMWFKMGQIHRGCDKPAVIYSNGTRLWFTLGKFTRVEFLDMEMAHFWDMD